MYLVLFGIGLLIAAAGFVTIGFGIPINAFSLGNTLIVAGTVAVVGGLILVAIAVAIRQINRMIEAIGRAPRHVPTAEPVDSLVPPTAPRAHAPARPVVPPKPVEAAAPKPVEVAVPKPPEVVMPRPEPRPPVEPRFPVASEAPGPLDWLRSKSKAPAEATPVAAEPPVVEVSDEAPLSPRAPQRPMFVPPSVNEVEPRAWSQGRAGVSADEVAKDIRPDVLVPPPPRVEHVRPAPAAERPRDANPDAGKAPKEGGLFDVVWPDARSKPMPAAEPARRESPRQESRQESRQEPRQEPRHEPAPQPRGTYAERPVAILKSGVIDGMAYTLYVDGSIEAELPQGTVRFASVDALRVHLEKSA